MKHLQEEIKKQEFQHVYLFFGEEAYLKQKYKEKLKKTLMPEEDTMNYSYFEGKKIDAKEIIDLAETMPFFAEKRVIFLENTGFFKNQCPNLPEYLAELPEYLCMVFVESEVDKRSRMYKAVKKYGRTVEFQMQDTKTLTRWVLGRLKQEGRKITQQEMDLFLRKTGPSIGNMEKELEKLLCYTMGREIITVEDIDAVCTTQISNHIFDMIKAVTEKNQKKALDLYYELLALREVPMRILILLERQFNQILLVKELMGEGYDWNSIAKKIGVQGFVVRNYMAFAKKYASRELRQAVEACVRTETNIKTGLTSDHISVEVLLIQLSQASVTKIRQ